MNWITAILCLFIVAGTFLFWEWVAWFTHKYIMHGFLWNWHRSHHSAHHHILERNDLFAFVFSIPCIAIFYYFSRIVYNPYMLAVGLGIFCYGIFYFIFHDIIVHQRIKWRRTGRNKYLKRIINAHYIHHSKHSKEGCEAFGFLYAPKKYEPKNFELKSNRSETK